MRVMARERVRPIAECTALACAVFALAALATPASAAAPDTGTAPYTYDVPLDPHSPWPKFRRDAAQTARSPVRPRRKGGRLWTFKAREGIFSSPVIGGDGTVFVGSADQNFYAIGRDGKLRWKLPTREIIDSAALLDDRGRVYVPSGDGHLYARDAATGRPVWTYAAQPASETGGLLNWFEGNVAIEGDGTLVVPDDNFRIYGINRDTATTDWAFPTRDNNWSLPAVDTATNSLFVGNNFFLGGAPNLWSIDGATGATQWSADIPGSVVASPLLTGDGKVIVGAFDGFVHAYDKATGRGLWEFPTRDHIYSSPAQLPNGTIVQPSTDGSVYGIDPDDGSKVWQYDTLNPIRSSPAVDGKGNSYIGGGDGRLYVLNADGTLRWAMKLSPGRRATINSSPALGEDVIVAADSNGNIFSVPYDYCLRPKGRRDKRCGPPPQPRPGAHLYSVSPFGILKKKQPRTLDANQPLALWLFVRKGRSRLAFINPKGLRVRVRSVGGGRDGERRGGGQDGGRGRTTLSKRARRPEVFVSGDRRYLVIVPDPRLPTGRSVEVSIDGTYVVHPQRKGLDFTGGRVGGRIHETHRFRVRGGGAGRKFPLRVPRAPGDRSGVWLLNQLALPLPDLLPSYNQIGFESLDFLLGMVESSRPGQAIVWMVGAHAAGTDSSRVVPDPSTTYLVPFVAKYDHGLLTLSNSGGATFVLNGFGIQTEDWRIDARTNSSGRVLGTPETDITVNCADVAVYGPFLEQLGLCAQGRPLRIFGGAAMAPYEGGVQRPPGGVGAVSFSRQGETLVADLTGSRLKPSERSVALLAVDARSGAPLPLDYGTQTTRTTDAAGNLRRVSVPLTAGTGTGPLRVYLMVDAYPAARGKLGG
ncbi:MAG: PQQ-binding-like beta-propeller repeat protein [Solirubrobacterales bacterium]|nr:PQQ-binding-like beta-propeller repeat protein [Solirubrobacterales bacterium]